MSETGAHQRGLPVPRASVSESLVVALSSRTDQTVCPESVDLSQREDRLTVLPASRAAVHFGNGRVLGLVDESNAEDRRGA